jgi:Xaa-Pro aminopeptidase
MSKYQIDPFQIEKDGRRRLPSFTRAERDRRYGRVRGLMAERDLDCLLAPAADVGEPQANSRYLCQIGGVQGGAWVVFPAAGEVTAIVASQREQRMWAAQLSWPEEIRWGEFSELVPDRIRELNLAGSRIGITGLRQQYRTPEGSIPFETWQRIVAALPGVTFVPANEVLEFARIVKGPEEIAVIQRITDANEAAIERMMELARPGVEEGELWIEMAKVLISHTADYPARLSLGSGSRTANAGNTMGLPIALEDGGVLSQEIDARLQGYRAQCNHSILTGRKNADRYREAMNIAIECFQGILEWVKPGETIGGLIDEFVRLAERRGAKGGGVLVHTNGLGADRPRVGPGPAAHDCDIVIEPGFTFTIKPQIDFNGIPAQIGEPITVSESGARRLGHRALTPHVTG